MWWTFCRREGGGERIGGRKDLFAVGTGPHKATTSKYCFQFFPMM